MKKLLFGVFGLCLLALPQVASAQSFTGSFQYTAKFLCGRVGSEQGLGVVTGHYNTVINVHSLRNKTALAFLVIPTTTSFEITVGTPSSFSIRFNLDRDASLGIICSDIKDLLGVFDNEGFVEGFVTIYSSSALDVTDVLTGQGNTGLSVLQVYQVIERAASVTVKPAPPL